MHGSGHMGRGCVLEVMTGGRKGCRLRKGREGRWAQVVAGDGGDTGCEGAVAVNIVRVRPWRGCRLYHGVMRRCQARPLGCSGAEAAQCSALGMWFKAV